MKIVVAVKLVPDTNADKRIDPATKRLVRLVPETVLNPFDEFAVEAALQLREKIADGSTVTVMTMAPESGKEVLRRALAMGADDAVILSDPGLAGCDVWGTAYALAAAMKLGGFDLVLTGTQSTDAMTGELPGGIAEHLGVPGLTYARSLEVADGRVRVRRETETGYQTVSAPLPALVSITKSFAQPRFASLKGIMGAKKKPISTLTLADLKLAKPVGSDAAKIELLNLTNPPARGKGRVATAVDAVDGAKQIIAFLQDRKLV